MEWYWWTAIIAGGIALIWFLIKIGFIGGLLEILGEILD